MKLLIIIYCVTLLEYNISGQYTIKAEEYNKSQLTQLIRRKRKDDDCKPTAKIKDCPPKFLLYVMMSFPLYDDSTPGCEGNELKYYWNIQSLDHDYKAPVTSKHEFFIIPELSSLQGTAQVNLKVTESSGKKKRSDSVKCYVYYQKDPPVPIIEGADLVTILPNTVYTVDATKSVNYENKKLKVIWEVECTKPESSSCSKSESFTCPKPPDSETELKWEFDTQSCSDFKISLKLKYGDESDNYPSTQQKLNMVMQEEIEVAHLTCALNCISTGYMRIIHSAETMLSISCDSNCPPSGEKGPDYQIEVKDIERNRVVSNANNVAYSDTGTKRIITVNKNVMERGTEYLLSAWIKNRPKSESIAMTLKTYEAKRNQCKIDPSSGTALETLFHLDCSDLVPKDYKFTFDVFQKFDSMEKGPLLIRSSSRTFETQLADSEGDGYVYIEVTYGKTLYVVIREVPVKVTGREIDIEEALRDLKELKHANEKCKMVLLSYAVMKEGEKELNEKDYFILKTKILHELSSVKLNNPCFIKALSHMIKVLNKPPFTEKYGSKLKDFCRDIKQASPKLNKRYQYNKDKITEDDGLKQCLDADFKRNATLDPSYDVNLSEHKMMDDEVILTENYPNYDEEFGDDIAQKAEEKLRVKNLEKAKSSAKKLEIGETVEDGSIVINKYNTDDAYKKEYKFNNNKGQAGTYKYKNPFPPPCKAIMSSSVLVDKNSYLGKYKDIVTTMININTACFESENETRSLSVPIKIRFDKLFRPRVLTHNGSITLSGDPSAWTNDYLNENMIIYRLNVFLGQSVFVKFVNLTENAKLKVAVTKNMRPSMAAFTKKFIVEESDNNSLTIRPEIDTVDGNSWIYIAILIHEDMLQESSSKNVSVKYNVRFSSKSCVIWNADNKEWDSGICQLEDSSDSFIECSCKHSSVFAARALNVETKLDNFSPLTFTLKLTPSFVIFLFVVIVYALYCLALCFTVRRNIENIIADIYFLADNLKNDLYAYLIIVKTGDVSNAGTTSNIMIKIVGTLGITKGHVLNYPDPDRKLLQRDTEQWFILTADKYLGEIKSIDLWFDSSGYRPTWFCDNIRIMDLQKYEACYFLVQSWLDILQNCHHFTIFPSDEDNLPWHYKIWENFKFHYGAAHTWNIFSKAHDREFSYYQRITILLSQLLNVYVFAILLHGSPELRFRDSFSINLYHYWKVMLIGIFSGLISFLINIFVVVIFRHSNEASTTKFILINKVLLPIWAKKYAWAFLIININLSLIYLTTFGFWLPMAESMQWIGATTTGVLFNIFVFESMFISFHELFLKYYKENHVILQKSYQYENIIGEAEEQRNILYNLFGEFLLRPYLQHLYKILPRETVVEKKLWYRLKSEVAIQFRDFIIFIIYFINIYIMFVFTKKQFMIFTSNQRLTGIIGEGMDYGSFPLEDIQSYNHIYDYIEYTLIPALNGRYWYSDWEIQNAGTMADFSSKVIGVAQIRQQRMDFDICKMQFKELNGSSLLCHSDHISTSNHSNRQYFTNSVWTYQTATETGLPFVTGSLQRYDGGGFIARLGRTDTNSQYVIDYLRRRKWIDISTKVVIIDFWAYNANYNLFTVVQIIIERSQTALMLKYLKIFSAHLIHIDNIAVELFHYIMILMMAFSMTIIIFTQMLNILKMRKRYFKEFWHYFDCALIITTIAIILGFIERSEMVKLVLETIGSADNNDFVLYFNLVKVSQSLLLLSALVVCLATLRLWKYLRFWAIFRTLERTILTSGLSLIIILMCIGIIIMAYSAAGNVLFGSKHPDMITHFKSTFILLLLFLNFDVIDTDQHILQTGYIAQIYKGTFMLCTIMLRNIITTIIIIHLKKSKLHFSNRRDEYTILNYVKEEYNYYTELHVNRRIHMRLRGGGVPLQSDGNSNAPQLIEEPRHLDPLQSVYPKAQEHRFANSMSLSLSKLRLMGAITKAILLRLPRRKDSKLRQKDYRAMASVVVDLAMDVKEGDKERGETDALFFTTKINNNRVKILSDERLLDIEYVVKRLLDNNYLDRNRENTKIRGDVRKFSKISTQLRSLLLLLDNFKFMLDHIDTADDED